MPVYRGPKCGEPVPREDARRCMTCGTVFDMDHEPVLDDGSGKPANVRKKEKRAMIIAIVIVVLVLVGALIWAVGNGKFIMSHIRNWHH